MSCSNTYWEQIRAIHRQSSSLNKLVTSGWSTTERGRLPFLCVKALLARKSFKKKQTKRVLFGERRTKDQSMKNSQEQFQNGQVNLEITINWSVVCLLWWQKKEVWLSLGTKLQENNNLKKYGIDYHPLSTYLHDSLEIRCPDLLCFGNGGKINFIRICWKVKIEFSV